MARAVALAILVLGKPDLTLGTADAPSGAGFLDLQFDRAVDILALDGSQIEILDGPAATRWLGTGGAHAIDERTFHVDLVAAGASSGGQVILNATALTGLVAVDNGGTWPGVGGLVLPFLP